MKEKFNNLRITYPVRKSFTVRWEGELFDDIHRFGQYYPHDMRKRTAKFLNK